MYTVLKLLKEMVYMKKDIDKYDWELDEKTQNIYENLWLMLSKSRI